VRPLEPPVPEQLGIERRHDNGVSLAVCTLFHRDALEQLREVRGVPPCPLERGRRLVGALRAQVHVSAADAPQLETARPADLMELEVPFVAGVAVVPAPDLRRGARVPHQRRDGPARPATGDAVPSIRRAYGPLPARRWGGGCGVVPLRVEPLHAQRNIAVGAEWAAGVGEMSVGEEIPEPRVRDVLLGAWANPPLSPPPPPPARPRARPFSARPLPRLRQPARRRRPPRR